MSLFRATQITRSTGVADQMPFPRELSKRFWSAMLMGNILATIDPGNTADLPFNQPRHATNGDSDFNIDNYPAIRLIVPWDGIYAINAFANAYTEDPPTGRVDLRIAAYGEVEPGWAFHQYAGGERFAQLETTRVGFPLEAGANIWAYATNSTDQPATFEPWRLEATYLGPIGTLYPLKGGGET